MRLSAELKRIKSWLSVSIKSDEKRSLKNWKKSFSESQILEEAGEAVCPDTGGTPRVDFLVESALFVEIFVTSGGAGLLAGLALKYEFL